MSVDVCCVGGDKIGENGEMPPRFTWEWSECECVYVSVCK